MKDKIIKKIESLLRNKYEEVNFALLFGSQAEERSTPLSDVDIGLHFTEEPDLLRVGSIVSDIENVTNRKVDVAVLNGLYRKKPAFCFELLKTTKPILVEDEDAYVEFKTNTFIYYLDVKPMLEKMKKQFLKRIESGKIGERNFSD